MSETHDNIQVLEITWYLAGPMTGIENYNYPAFEDACKSLRGYGLRVLSPHEVPWPIDYLTMNQEELWTEMMHRTKELIDAATGIILLPGWPWSRGALNELEMARDRRLPVVYFNSHQSALVMM